MLSSSARQGHTVHLQPRPGLPPHARRRRGPSGPRPAAGWVIASGRGARSFSCRVLLPGRVVTTLVGHAHQVTALAASPVGCLLSGDEAGLVVFWTADKNWTPIRLDRVTAGLTAAHWGKPSAASATGRAGRSNAPVCPSCHKQLVRRSQKAPPHLPFWGCPNFPRCHYTRNIG